MIRQPTLSYNQIAALAIASAARWPALPDLTTVGDFVPGFEAGAALFGIAAPKKTPTCCQSRHRRRVGIRTQVHSLGKFEDGRRTCRNQIP
jgi:hypothetical protein